MTANNRFTHIMLQPISAGFPNAAEEAADTPLDLNKMVVKNAASTFYMRVEGDSMLEANIHSGDIVVIDKSLVARSNDIIVAYIDGDFTLKRFINKGNVGYLMPANQSYPPIKLTEDSDFMVWGVVTYTIHKYRG